MRSKKEKLADRKRKRKYKWIDGIVVLIFILLAGIIIWLGTNGWSMSKAINSLQNGQEPPVEFQEIESASERGREDEVDDPEGVSEEGEKPEEIPLRKIEDAPIIEKSQEKAEEAAPEKPSSAIDYIKGQQLPKEPKYVDGVLLANKQYPLPRDYAPGESEEAREAYNEMEAAAVTSGINLHAFSTYRSYEYQVTLYNRYVERDGQEAADRYSARPGYSEHQTGLAFDIGEVNHERHWASNSFGDTEAAKWLAANAHKYGFILRYPEGKEEVTGYMHESWHYRYVGKKRAAQIFKHNITLEEYLGVQ
ncbi:MULTISPECIES: M15 family metallopeptidase [unclassified Sporosarcina]|uniref:M15 family metallopeptidase n=1 Tax=unclassified Sporosarcina TaxID=2647733 RepID=UPI000A19F4B5|nr:MULTISPECIES: M15 family metallopeptidase [unclassified Sporosarcina]PID19701.1 D-alanyl-D-alanine carboxypeptidase [Sporosarcina sp. P35]